MFNVHKSILNSKRLRLFSITIRNFIDPKNIEVHTQCESSAKPYKSIPGPSILKMIVNYLPGGRFSKLSYSEVHKIFRDEFGPIYKIKGIFGKRDIVVVDEPKDFETVYRVQGSFPIRRGLDTFTYYRKVYRKEKFPHTGGIMCEQGQAWWDLRQKLNGIMMKPHVVNEYIEVFDQISSDFIKRLQNMRDSNLETPPNLYYQLNNYSLETIGYMTMNQRWGLVDENPNHTVKELLDKLHIFIELLYEFDFQPSLWKIYKTSKFKYFLRIIEDIEEIISGLFEKSLEQIKDQIHIMPENKIKISVFEKLQKMDDKVAKLMILDLIITGTDTSSSSTVAILYYLAINPDKQNILREELLKILPEKDSPLTAENMKNMPYLRACIKEAQRMMPVLSGIIRAPTQDIVLSGYHVPKHTDVYMQNESLYSENLYFAEAKTFLPERWLRHSDKYVKNNPFVYLPFGYGHRICVGQRFANLQMECLTARLVRNFHLEWHHSPPKIRSTTINVPHGKLKLRLREYV